MLNCHDKYENTANAYENNRNEAIMDELKNLQGETAENYETSRMNNASLM